MNTTRRRRIRIRIVVLTIFCLLFQQMAVAAYVCTLEGGERVADCHQPLPERAELPDPVCAKHCAPDTSTSAETRSLGVPALALPPLLHLPVLLAPDGGELRLADASPTPDPPPRLRYARLLI